VHVTDNPYREEPYRSLWAKGHKQAKWNWEGHPLNPKRRYVRKPFQKPFQKPGNKKVQANLPKPLKRGQKRTFSIPKRSRFVSAK
jgi:hypothetical protein